MAAVALPLAPSSYAGSWEKAIAKVKAIPKAPIKNQLVVPPMKSGHTVDLKEVSWSDIESFRMLGHANMPLKMLMVLDSSTRDEVQRVFEVVRDLHREQEAQGLPSNERIKFHLVIRSPRDVARLDISPKDYEDIVEIDQWFSTSDIWMQDWGEVAAAKLVGADKERTLIFDSRRGRGGRPAPEGVRKQPDPGSRGLKGLSDVLARLWNASIVRGPQNQGGKGNYGGNIEVAPDDTMIIGNTATPALRKLFSDAGYKDKMAVLETDWLIVGHVDEYLSTLPAPETDLGYVVVRADPGATLEAIASATDEEWQANLTGMVEAAFRQVRRFPEVLHAEHSIESLYDDLNDMRAALTSRGDAKSQERGRGLVAVNRKAEKIIARNVEKYAQFVKNKYGAAMEMKTVSFPGLFRQSGGRQVALIPGVANMVVLGDRLVIPDPLLPSIRDSIQADTESLGYKPTFISDLTYHFMHGQLHCGSNVFRHPNRYVHPRYEQSFKAKALHQQ